MLLAGVWATAAYFLWQTAVPGTLRIPHVDEHLYFSVPELHRAAGFALVSRLDWLGSELTLLVVLALYARYGVRWMRESAAGPIGTGMLLGMLGFAIVWLAQLPFNVLELWWERRHHLNKVGYAASLFGNWGALGGQFLFLSFALLVVMRLARSLRDLWWLPGAVFFTCLVALFSFLTPWLSGGQATADRTLASEATSVERAEHVATTPVVVESVHSATTEPNAEAMGMGPSRRVVVWDTLLDGRFSRAEVRFVLAHEVGHLARHHIWKDIGWYALFAFPGTFLIARVTRRRGGMARPEAVPLSLLVFVVLGLLALPLQNVITRHMEAEADWMALRTTHDPAAATALFRRFSSTTLEEPDPPTWDYLLLENHPTLLQRIAMVRAWESIRNH